MKKIISLILCIGFIFFAFIGVSTAGLYTTGDMNSDGKIGLEEAILALKTVAGISFQGGDESESNDFESEADEISPVSNISGKIGYSGDQEDWFKIVAPENGLLQVTIENLNPADSTNGTLTKGLVYKKEAASLVEIAQAGYNHAIQPNKSYATKPLPVSKNGSYYIKISQWYSHVAPYEVKTSFIKLQLSDSGEPNSNYSEAQVLQENQTITALIGYGGDEEDWYKIQMPANGVFQFSVENLHSEDVGIGKIGGSFLYQKVGADLVEKTQAAYNHAIAAGHIRACGKTSVANNGTYFIKVPKFDHDSSPYQLNTSMTEIQTEDYGEPNDNKSEAYVLQENQTITALIGYGNDEEDWYMIQMPGDGMFQFSVENLNSEDVVNGKIGGSFLYQQDGADLVEIAQASYNHTIEEGYIRACDKTSVSENGTYFIKVPKYYNDSSPYQLQTFFSPN